MKGNLICWRFLCLFLIYVRSSLYRVLDLGLCCLSFIHVFIHFFITIADSEIQCFECNSFDDPRCHDRFNYNHTNKDAMPDTALCNGCCVKMVLFTGTGTEKICEISNSLIFSVPVPINCTILTQQPLHGAVSGIASLFV